MDKESKTTLLYGLTNTNHKNLKDMIMYDEKMISISQGYKGYLYDNNILRYIPNGSDFKYVKQIEVFTESVYIVREKKDIISGILTKDGEIDIKLLNKKTKQNYSGYIILAPLRSQKYSRYFPHFLFNDLSKCIKSSMTVKKQSKHNKWISVEPCNTLSLKNCVLSDTCIWKNSVCSTNSELSKQLFETLNKIMKPSKYYMFSEFELNSVKHGFRIDKTTIGKKPKGFWFSIGDEWLQHLKKTNFWINKYNYLYEIELSKENVTIIDNMKGLQELSSDYGVREKFNIEISGNSYMIPFTSKVDWYNFVKKTKSQGIIISPNLKKQYYKYSSFNDIFNVFYGTEWYLSWDIASGVIWDPKAIKNLNLIYKKDVGKFI